MTSYHRSLVPQGGHAGVRPPMAAEMDRLLAGLEHQHPRVSI
jgi:hypothetical protein